MRLEHYPVDRLKKELVGVVGRHLDLTRYRLFFFGSRVSGTATGRADIDLGIEGPEPVPWEVLVQIKEELATLPLLYKIDVVDFRRASKEFLAVASQQRERIL